ncbi:SNF2 domain-containing protein CLASSY 1-like [Impatiens glandulifera]|uniref:SNF2 domain-containing protein CLASSY 1-like n=1 Tax=Impatiens glandulifera TaxID=253017 RepID=UPI001FB0BB65|nr:SNF2 domain-containing protein CLASSY 1-like [Impatiens glandulifera]XP_047316176.1 SNF2 domain-containing protein CLASSY 1-like [Impatiens glandulifera]
MKRRILQSTHRFDARPFEVFSDNSWHPVESLLIKRGAITMNVVYGDDIIEEQFPVSNLRIKTRQTTLADCLSFLRPGLDVSVLSTAQCSEDSSEENLLDPVWREAKICSVERNPHERQCVCQYFVRIYVNQGPLGVMKKALHKETIPVQINQISILQRLQRNPCQNKPYRWDLSENCLSIQNYKLFTGRFSADLAWLITASVKKDAEFEVRSIDNKIVYGIRDGNLDGLSSNALNFKEENEQLVPIIVPLLPTNTVHDEADCDLNSPEADLSYDLLGLRRSKRRFVQPDRYMGADCLSDSEFEISRVGTYKTYKWHYVETPLALSIQADHAYHFEEDRYFEENRSTQSHKRSSNDTGLRAGNLVSSDERVNQHQTDIVRYQPTTVPVNEENNEKDFEVADPFDAEIPENYSKEFGDIVSKYVDIRCTPNVQNKSVSQFDLAEYQRGQCSMVQDNRGRRKRGCNNMFPGKERDSFRDSGPTGSKKSFTVNMYRDMIKKCTENIQSNIHKEQPPVIDQWKDFRATSFTGHKEGRDSPAAQDDSEDEDPEIQGLWKEMELGLTSIYLHDNEESKDKKVDPLSDDEDEICKHEFILNEEVGILCKLCGFVSTEIRHVSPTFLHYANSNKVGGGSKDDPDHEKADKDLADLFTVPASLNIPISDSEDNVWALIPDLKDKLHLHQKKAFEFLWRNIAGSIIPACMEPLAKKRGGCVVSHSPGAGKTFLIIAFLVSYLKLFPGSRPLVIAPKTTLYTWYKEIIKWKIPIPVYQIHGGQTYRGEVSRQKLRTSNSKGPKPNLDVMHVLDCLEKIQKWLSHPSILIMGYTSFLTMTRDDSKYSYRRHMSQVLKQSPGLVILDEGHNPRSTKSRLRKALMKVDTGLRVLLSGTLFQNNFGEYFNTLTLARPRFVNEVLKALDPKFKKRKKDSITRFSIENRARKFFVDKISRHIDSNKTKERAEALNLLKNLTSGFIDVYECGATENLPGLQCYTLMMKSSPYQQELLVKLQNQRPQYKGFPLELELLITLGSIHPWLIRTTSCSAQYFTNDILENLDKYKFDLKMGSKVRFVMSLIPRLLIRKEKLLIFCHNIAPINLFLEIFESFYGWRKGVEALVLQGDIELFERGRIIEKFEEPGGPSRVMLASISACAEGISLTAASRVILLDSEWNPSRSKQAIARAFRPGQDKMVYVYQLLAKGTLEEEKHSRTTWKEWVSCMIFSEELVEDPSKWQAEKIEDDVLREIVEEDKATLFHMIMKNEKASNVGTETPGYKK